MELMDESLIHFWKALHSQLATTLCPGTDVYMPPEAVKEEPVYTEKIDCFSFGVIIIQISMKHYRAKPSARLQAIQPSSLVQHGVVQTNKDE